MLSSLILLMVTLNYVSSANPRQRCDAPTFSCQFNDPCDPLCVSEQLQYPGRSARVHIKCEEGRCTEQQCPRRTTWNQANQRCEGGNGLEARCAFGKFDCEARNPCTPTLCEDGVQNYPGPSPRRYVTCTGGCSKAQCPRRQVWDQEKQRCVRKTIVCPVGQTFDEAMLLCVAGSEGSAKSAVSAEPAGPACRWREIAVSTPEVNCSNDFIFHNRLFNDNERGFLRHDGFVDCEAASEGNNYYVEDRSNPGFGIGNILTCHPSTGLCFNMTSLSNGGWFCEVKDVHGPSHDDVTYNENLSNLDHEVPASCVEMSTVADVVDYMNGNISEFYSDCYTVGGTGSYLYSRPATYRGTCSDRIPCDTISSDDVTMYKLACE